MPILHPSELEGVVRPELVFGFVAPVGTPLQHLSRVLTNGLEKHGYEAEVIRLSEYLEGYNLETPEPPRRATEYQRLNSLMSRGNQLRERMGGGETLALMAAATINNKRPDTPPHALSGKAFIIHQLKHPDEVVWLRTIYGGAFHLIGVFCPERVRLQYLHVMRGLSEEEARALIERDKGEESKYGQHVTRTFHHSDLFVDLRGYDGRSVEDAEQQLERYLRLLFGTDITTPTREEYGMFLAHSAALRSADLSRQVGASILTSTGEVVALGANEVPAPGGGQYWGGDRDHRDFVRGEDANEVIKRESLREVMRLVIPEWEKMDPEEQEREFERAEVALAGSRMMNLTEFGRAVHAEMEAILSAGRVGTPVRKCELYTTTFPCHNCAKHIVDSGITRVLYIEPYPKSLADRLHNDAIAFPEDADTEDKVVFEAFQGVAPRVYPMLFSSLTPEGNRIRRKSAGGAVQISPAGLRVRATPLTHIDREAIVARAVRNLTALKKDEES